MKTNHLHINLAIRVFTNGPMDDIDLRLIVLRILSMTDGKGPLTKDERGLEVVTTTIGKCGEPATVLEVMKHHLNTLLGENLIETRMINGDEVYTHTPYFHDLIYWQKIKAGLINRPPK